MFSALSYTSFSPGRNIWGSKWTQTALEGEEWLIPDSPSVTETHSTNCSFSSSMAYPLWGTTTRPAFKTIICFIFLSLQVAKHCFYLCLWLHLALFVALVHLVRPNVKCSSPHLSAVLGRDAPQQFSQRPTTEGLRGPWGRVWRCIRRDSRLHRRRQHPCLPRLEGLWEVVAVRKSTCSLSPRTLRVHHGSVGLGLPENRTSMGRGAWLVFVEESSVESKVMERICRSQREQWTWSYRQSNCQPANHRTEYWPLPPQTPVTKQNTWHNSQFRSWRNSRKFEGKVKGGGKRF